MIKKRLFQIGGGLFLILLIGWSIRVIVFPPQRHAVLGPQVVQATKAMHENWQQRIEATGSLSANQGVTVSPETFGIVTAIFFKSGDYVEKNTPLVQLNASIERATLASALSQIPLSESDYQRMLDLYKKNVGSKQDVDTKQANLEQARADAAKAKAELELKLIKAPFSGQLGLRKIDLGDFLDKGEPIVDLESVDPMRVEFTVPQKYVPLLKIGQKVTMTSDAYSDRDYTGKIYAIDSALDLNTRSIGIWANIPNDDHSLVPGSFVNVTLYIGEPQSVIVIPQQAIVYNDVSDFVYTVSDNKAVKTDVKVTQTQGKWVSVTGINANDTVIISGQNKLSDGVKVNPTLVANDKPSSQQQS